LIIKEAFMPRTSVVEKRRWVPAEGGFEQIPLRDVGEPGVYVDTLYGNLYRITPEMLKSGAGPFGGFVSNDQVRLVRISGDYALPLDEARILAANASLKVNF
jgi:hypothetical protein